MSVRAEGLREAKKRRTRQMISDVATRLFKERGFDKVTIADIASAAGVAKMTVTNYFPLKEDLVLDMGEEHVTTLTRAVGQREPGESALAALRRDYLERVRRHDPLIPDDDIAWQRLVRDTPALRARLRQIHEQAEHALAAVLGDETGDAGITTKLAAAQLAAVDRLLFFEGQRLVLEGRTSDEIFAILADTADRAFGLLEPALGGYARR
ncbi:TetR/AcrR family transcriptional regulator [Nonomuraea sp. NPDC003707]